MMDYTTFLLDDDMLYGAITPYTTLWYSHPDLHPLLARVYYRCYAFASCTIGGHKTSPSLKEANVVIIRGKD